MPPIVTGGLLTTSPVLCSSAKVPKCLVSASLYNSPQVFTILHKSLQCSLKCVTMLHKSLQFSTKFFTILHKILYNVPQNSLQCSTKFFTILHKMLYNAPQMLHALLSQYFSTILSVVFNCTQYSPTYAPHTTIFQKALLQNSLQCYTLHKMLSFLYLVFVLAPLVNKCHPHILILTILHSEVIFN